jgi:hypothetical protein
MITHIEMGTTSGAPACLDLAELLTTRLLVQGNSGSGKSHLLRRLLEQSAPYVQQVVIDPEGDFVTLAEKFGHVVIDADQRETDLQRIAARVREHRVSVVLNLESLDVEAQMRRAAAFLGGLFDANRDLWFPVLVVVDEAQLFAPAAAGEVSDEARRVSLGAMTNLMCRGRKRGLAGVIATQRLAKLAKNVAAEASNFLMGRTFLDIDMARAADLLGLERRQAEMFRDLERGHFVALGPALSRRPLPIRIGSVETGTRSAGPSLLPLPEQESDRRGLIFEPAEEESWRPRARVDAPKASPEEVLVQLSDYRPAETPAPQPLTAEEKKAALVQILREMLEEPDWIRHAVSVLYQDFTVRCRMRGIGSDALSFPAFKRRLAEAQAGIDETAREKPEWSHVMGLCADLPDDLQGVFLRIVKAALQSESCPTDEELAEIYGTQSPSRIRRLLSYLEERGAVVCRVDFRGQRIIAVPGLNAETAPGTVKASLAAQRR